MYCINCAEEIPNGNNTCPKCGTPVVRKEEQIEKVSSVDNVNNSAVNNFDRISKGLSAFSLIIPPVGFIFYFATKKDTPSKAKSALKAGIFGLVTYAIAAVIFFVFALPLVKRYAFKYECVKNTPGAVYDYKKYQCIHPDGKIVQKGLK